jgi:O-antigen ligase
MKMAQLKRLHFNRRLVPLIGVFFLLAGCGQWGMDPDVRIGLILLIAIVSFITIFSKPILGVYAVSVISVVFSPTIGIGFANLYFHQWVILIAFLASLSSGLILGNIHNNIKSEINLPMMIFVGTLLLSMSHAPNMLTGVKSFLYIGVFISSYYLGLLCINKKDHLRVFIAVLIITTSIVCVISLMYHGSGRLGSLVLRNPNSFGNFLALVIPFSVSLLLYGSFQRRKKLILAFLVVFMFVNLVLTFSRSAWIGVFTAILSLFILKPKGSLALIFCGIISAVFLFAPIQKRIFKDISDPGARYRIVKAKIAYDKFKEHPILGNGLGSFHYEAQFSDVWAYRAHSTLENNYLLMLAEGGIIEFLAFLYLMIALGRRAIVLVRKVKDPFLYPILLGSIASIISPLAAGMFEDTLFFPKNNWLIGMFMGLIIVIGKIHEGSMTASDTVEGETDAESMNSQMERG